MGVTWWVVRREKVGTHLLFVIQTCFLATSSATFYSSSSSPLLPFLILVLLLFLHFLPFPLPALSNMTIETILLPFTYQQSLANERRPCESSLISYYVCILLLFIYSDPPYQVFAYHPSPTFSSTISPLPSLPSLSLLVLLSFILILLIKYLPTTPPPLSPPLSPLLSPPSLLLLVHSFRLC